MAIFHSRCPETADAETRTVTASEETGGIPAGEFAFVEFYCDEVGCDCRRVILMVRPKQDPERCLATINFGWETPAFYRKWSKDPETEIADSMAGPTLEIFAPQSRYADAFLDFANEHLLSDPAYVERLKRHYDEFKATLRPAGRKKGAGKVPLNWRRRIRPGG